MAAVPSTINPAVLNALTLQWKRNRANMDDQQNRYRINYNTALQKMGRTYADVNLRGQQGLADRGMVQSGPALAQQAKLRGEYAQQQATASQGLNTNMATIARRRLEADQEYNSQKILAALGLALK